MDKKRLPDFAIIPTRPPSPTRPGSSKATLDIEIYGLALLCANPSSNNVQIGFLGGHGHKPVHVHVYDPDSQNNVDFEGRDGKTYMIQIEKTHPRSMGYFYYDGRRYPKDSKDFRWMPDMHELHPTSTLRSSAKGECSAILEMSDAVFYTADKANNDATIVEEHNGQPPIKEKYGRLLGAEITCDANDAGVNISIIEDGVIVTGFPITLAKKSKPWEMEIHTLSRTPQDHMHMLYDCLENTGNYKYSLRYATNEARIQSRCRKFRSNEYACQPFPDGDGPY